MLTKSLVLLLALAGAASGQTISHGEQVIPYAASLSLNATYAAAFVTLTGNVTSINAATGSFGGQSFHLTICQGTGGPYTIPTTWSNTTGVTAIATTGCTRFRLVWDDPSTTWVSTAEGLSAAGPAGPAGATGAAATPNTASAPLVISSNNISIPVATTSAPGYLASADWTTFNNKQSALTLTTTGTSGAATLSGGTLNIPNYATGGSPALSSVTAATGSNAIANGNNPQTWNCAETTNSQACMTFGETTAATGTGDSILTVKTLSGSTAAPLALSFAGAQTLTFGYVSSAPALTSSTAMYLNAYSSVALQHNGTNVLLAGSSAINAYQPIVATYEYQGNSATVASASTTTLTTPIVTISGAATITQFTVPSGLSASVGACYDILAGGAWSTTAGSSTGQPATSMTAVSGTQYRGCFMSDQLFHIK